MFLSRRAHASNRTVSEYRLSLRARADLINIYAFTDARFGRYQAEAYHAGLRPTLFE